MERFFGGSLLPVEGEEEGFVPSVDFKETEEGFELTAEVPGLGPEEIEVSLTGDVLVLKGEKKEEHEESKCGYHLVERRFGSFYRGFRLPVPVDRGKLSAIHKDGVLRISLPKVTGGESLKLEVKHS